MRKNRATPAQVQKWAMQAFKRMTDDRRYASFETTAPEVNPRVEPEQEANTLDWGDNVLKTAPWLDTPKEIEIKEQAPSPEPMPTPAPEKKNATKSMQPAAQLASTVPELRSDIPEASELPQDASPQAPAPQTRPRRTRRRERPIQVPSEPMQTAPKDSRPVRPARPVKTPPVIPPKPTDIGPTPVKMLNDQIKGMRPAALEQVNFDFNQWNFDELEALQGESLANTVADYAEQNTELMERIGNLLAILTMRLRLVENVLDTIGG
jgi:hypothetical protein